MHRREQAPLIVAVRAGEGREVAVVHDDLDGASRVLLALAPDGHVK